METIYYHFDVWDWLVFLAMLIVCSLTGIYYGCRTRFCTALEEPNLSEYLQGKKQMTPIPVALSLIASYVSAVTIIGTPTEIYNFGSQYSLIVLSIWLSGVIVAYVYLPVFFKLQVNSSYEYLEMRFSRNVRSMASVLFVIDEILFLPIVLYVPSLTFNQVTGINVHVIGITMCLICVFYTVLGGIKTVVYTDALQTVIMFVSVIAVVFLGIISLGPGVIWSRSREGGRLIFGNFSPSLYERHTVFSVIVGGVLYWTAFNSVNQTMVQRYLSMATEKESRISIVWFSLGISGFVALCIYSGLLIYGKYYECDPLSAGRIHDDDQMFPLYVMECFGHLPGVPGLFIAGVFGAGLSTLSAMLNSTAAVIFEDFFRGVLKLQLQDNTAMFLVKIVILVLGSITIGLLYLVEHMSGILAGATAVSAIAAGTTFGVFSLGMLVPWANSIGTIVGAIVGSITSCIITIGSQYVIAAGYVVPHKLHVNVDNCLRDYGINATATVINYPDESHIFPLFRMTFFWITPWGILSTMIAGTIVSFATGKTDLKSLDPEMISPAFRWLLPPEAQSHLGSASKRIRETVEE